MTESTAGLLWAVRERLDILAVLQARAAIREMRDRGPCSALAEVEFRVFSQFGEDGIIQYLIRAIGIPPEARRFVEFGVEDYSEANTRFLLINDNWRGLLMDSNASRVQAIQQTSLYWRHDLTAIHAHVTRENINGLLEAQDFRGEIGLLSIDIDGNDYWVWEAIEAVRPIIVVAEYNSVLGRQHAIVVPYDPAFAIARAHPSTLYFGASLRALCQLAKRKGYVFVGCESAGANAFFVHRNWARALPKPSVEAGYVESRFRTSRGPDGQLTYVSGEERARLIADQLFVDVENGRTVRLDALAPL
jgi:hypothetical protein